MHEFIISALVLPSVIGSAVVVMLLIIWGVRS
jgi:hypothetical protein